MMIEQNRLTPAHCHNGASVRNIMLWVCLCLVPGMISYTWFFGVGVLIQCLLATVFAFVIEAVCLKIRKQDLRLFLCDGSVIVTAVLFALLISPYTPWWVNLIGIGFGLVFAKHIYGGLGHNLFNPAVVAVVFIMLCFPNYMDQWPYTLDQPYSEESINNTFTRIFSSTDIIRGLPSEDTQTPGNSFKQ
ncbi:MAG: electron transport complex subunit RsxD, partial [Gammaproteobacteria bacterium]|nr:electron transport complex subunit RsxD [Gammaproteobacteria bacterium]